MPDGSGPPKTKGMAATLSTQSLVAAWEQFLADYSKAHIEEAALNYPETRSVEVDYNDLDRRDPTLAQYLLDHPRASIQSAEEALKLIEVPVEPRPALRIRVKNLPRVNRYMVRKLRAEHLGKFVAVEGLIKKVVEVRPKLRDATFQCQRCGAVFNVQQEEQILTEPKSCDEGQGGCGRDGPFKLLTEESKFIDSQKIEIQESHEDLRGGAQPERITVYLEEDLTGKLYPGDSIVINGVFRAQQRRQGSLKLAEFVKVVDCVSFEVQQMEFEEIEIRPEDIPEIESISKSGDVYRTIRESFAPEIYGMEKIKDSLILSMFGGVAKEFKDGSRIRGDIHCLLVGDPGVAKSQLLRYLSKLSPRSIYTSGKGTSAAGLTATAVRDEFGEGQWSLEAGALVLADKGVACIDELDKMDENDQSAMHQAMEQQEISVSKAGISATLKSRCAVIGAANPKTGRFDDFAPIVQQINMPPPLLSRFDLIFSLRDRPNKETDERIARHILGTHRAGEVHMARKRNPDGSFTEAQEKLLMERIKPVVEEKTLRRYVAYAKRNFFPVLTEEAANAINTFYQTLRNQASGTIGITPRQIEAIIRLTEASAKIRLSTEATIEDATRAISIFTEFLKTVGWNEEAGTIDIDIIAAGASSSQQERMRKVLEIIRRLNTESGGEGAKLADVLEQAQGSAPAIPSDKVEEAIRILKERGSIFQPRGDRYAPL
jgi:replicative DNA helicase Mcm